MWMTAGFVVGVAEAEGHVKFGNCGAGRKRDGDWEKIAFGVDNYGGRGFSNVGCLALQDSNPLKLIGK